MQVRVRVFRHVVVENDVNTLDVHSPAKEVGSHQDPPLEIFKLLIP